MLERLPVNPLVACVHAHAEASPQRVAVSHLGRDWCYAELSEAIQSWADALQHAGLRPGVALVTFLDNRAVMVVVALACLHAGVPFVPLDPSLRPMERAALLARLQPGLILCAQGVTETLADQAIATLAPDAWLAPPLPRACGVAHPDLADAAVLQFSSGSTGVPKGIILTLSAVTARVRNLVSALALTREDVTLCTVPLTHSHGLDCLALPTLFAGGRLILSDAAAAIPAVVFATIARERVTFFSSVPTFYQLALRTDKGRSVDLSSLRLPFCGSAALSTETIQQFAARYNVRIRQGYGLAEIGVITLHLAAHADPLDASIGRPIGGIRWRLDEQGQLIVSGEAMFSRYFGDAAGTAERLIDGELYTQDCVQVDAEGRFYIVGRLNDVIVVAGQKVYPIEIERTIAQLPEVALCAVVPMTDPLRGEVPVLHVELTPGSREVGDDPVCERIVAHVRSQLSDFKVPARVVVHERLPRSSLGKVLKSRLHDDVELRG
jgi:acyl-CoA synthetase (AMP-forming)/AMP-acid ligase II